MEGEILSQTHDPKLDGARARFVRDVDAISADENDLIPKIKIPKGAIGILTGGKTKRVTNGAAHSYLMVKVGLWRGNIRSIHLVSVRRDYLCFDWGDVN